MQLADIIFPNIHFVGTKRAQVLSRVPVLGPVHSWIILLEHWKWQLYLCIESQN